MTVTRHRAGCLRSPVAFATLAAAAFAGLLALTAPVERAGSAETFRLGRQGDARADHRGVWRFLRLVQSAGRSAGDARRGADRQAGDAERTATCRPRRTQGCGRQGGRSRFSRLPARDPARFARTAFTGGGWLLLLQAVKVVSRHSTFHGSLSDEQKTEAAQVLAAGAGDVDAAAGLRPRHPIAQALDSLALISPAIRYRRRGRLPPIAVSPCSASWDAAEQEKRPDPVRIEVRFGGDHRKRGRLGARLLLIGGRRWHSAHQRRASCSP